MVSTRAFSLTKCKLLPSLLKISKLPLNRKFKMYIYHETMILTHFHSLLIFKEDHFNIPKPALVSISSSKEFNNNPVLIIHDQFVEQLHISQKKSVCMHIEQINKWIQKPPYKRLKNPHSKSWWIKHRIQYQHRKRSWML